MRFVALLFRCPHCSPLLEDHCPPLLTTPLLISQFLTISHNFSPPPPLIVLYRSPFFPFFPFFHRFSVNEEIDLDGTQTEDGISDSDRLRAQGLEV